VSVKGESGIEVDLRAGNAQDLPFTDTHFDAVVAMLVLCTMTTAGPYRWAVAEAARGLRPGGWLRLLEHVRTPFLPVRVLQGVLNPLPYYSKTTISCASLCGTSRMRA